MATASSGQQGKAAGAAAAAGGAATAGAAATPPAAAAGLSGALAVASAAVLSTFVTWLAALREQHRVWLARELGAYGEPNDIREVIAQEMHLEQQFAKNAAARLASALPAALAISDDQERQAKLRQLLADEQRFARQRAEAMAARAIAALSRFQLRRTSPLGAFWRLGVARNHTEGCLFMADKFWPWSVLDRVHPPRHYGCTSSLHDYTSALHAGWMSPSDVPDERDAVRAARGVVMEGSVAEALLAELDLRERLVEAGIERARLTSIPLEGVKRV